MTHPNFSDNYVNNIALIRTEQAIKWNARVQPIAGAADEIDDNYAAIVAGWENVS